MMYSTQTTSSNDIIVGTFRRTFGVLSLTNLTIGWVGIILISVPYIGFGLSTMCVIFWRLINGKTGYKSHFKNPLNTPLI